MNKSVLIYLIGKPGVGKLTIANALSQKLGFVVCDNHLINNPIFRLLNLSRTDVVPDFAWNYIERIRLEVFACIERMRNMNYILTNCLLNNKTDEKLYQQVAELAKNRNSIFVPVRLEAIDYVHLKRIIEPDRALHYKTMNISDALNNEQLLEIQHPNLLDLDTSDLSPEDAADKIIAHINTL